MARVNVKYYIDPILDESYGVVGHRLKVEAAFYGKNTKERAKRFSNTIAHTLLDRFPVKESDADKK